jgi:hypothetical protein
MCGVAAILAQLAGLAGMEDRGGVRDWSTDGEEEERGRRGELKLH